jgi:mono/diheme cytochrome c family protein
LAVALLPLALGACEWFTDFKEQPKVDPWETPSDSVPPRAAPQYSVPVTGTFVPAYAVSYQPLPATIDSMSAIRNPTPPNDSSLANGRRYYQVNCAVCHGDNGTGNGPATKYGMPGINITMDITKNRTDGYIYGMIRNGRGLMPTYNRIEEMDRWDVVNYVRGLQGRLDRQVPLGPLGYPGQGGYTVPGHSVVGPTRPVYHNVSQYTDSALARQVRGIPGSTAAPLPAEHGGTP